MPLDDWGRRPGIVLDTGALIELQKWTSPLFKELKNACTQDLAILIPAPVLVEWIAGGSRENINRVLDLATVVDLDAELAKIAGAGLVATGHPRCTECGVRGGPAVADAVAMAIANGGDDTVLTGDAKDLEALNGHFDRAKVRVLNASSRK